MLIGIDLGTTNSVVAYLADDGPQIILNAVGGRLTPSVAALDPQGKLLVGAAAKDFQVLQPDRAASLFKRHMGTDWQDVIDGRKFAPEELSALVLRALKEDAEAHFGQPIERAVITVPAYFNEHQRKATINAGRIAGLRVERIVNEPTAAAMAYGFHELKDDKKLVVLDLGGGTFDVSIVELFEGVLEVKASSGENFLGGEDFTRTLAAKVLARNGESFERAEHESPRRISRLLQQCERAKCRLTKEESVTIRVPNRDGAVTESSVEATVTREEFRQWTESLLVRIELPIRRALGDAGLKPSDVDEVLLVGGATRMPQFIQRVGELFGKPPQCRLNPDEVVALGAAVQAGLIGRNAAVEEMVVTDVAPFTLGVAISREFGTGRRDGYFLPIIHRNTTIPISRVERVNTVSPNQTSVSVQIFQGESRHCQDNLSLGEFEVTRIPLGPAGQEIDLRFTYDLNGVLEVEALVVKTGQKVTHIVTRNAQGLTPRQIEEAVTRMQTLKTHPREEAANRATLQKAERLYQELPPRERGFLDQLLSGFEQALETGDRTLMEEHREALESFVSRYDVDPFAGDADGGE